MSILRKLIKFSIITFTIFLLLLLITPYVAITIFANHHVNYQGKATYDKPLQDIYQATDFNLSENQMYLETEDGLNIWTSEIFADNPKGVIIYLSGILQPSVTYYYGHAKYMREQGYASFLLEVRGHGQSDGNKICFGYEEVKDVEAVVDYIRSKKEYDGVPIIIQGASMGGAIAINAFGQIKEIDALIAMSAYSSFEDVVIDNLDHYGIPKFIQFIEKPLIRSALTLSFGSDAVSNIKPINQIMNDEGRPMLLIACTGDTEVPAVNMLRLQKANPNAETWLRDSWEHFIIKDCDFKNVSKDKEYWDKILNFIETRVPRS